MMRSLLLCADSLPVYHLRLVVSREKPWRAKVYSLNGVLYSGEHRLDSLPLYWFGKWYCLFLLVEHHR